ncbi:hypothetical protein PHAVU_005G111750 [Phaseolus vulgaris]
MVLTHICLDDFCGGILVSSQGLGVFWEILMLCSRRMTVKGGWLLIRFLVMNSWTGLILMIFLVCLLQDLVILGVTEGEGCIEFTEDWIGLYVMECVWMNGILVLIRFLLKIALIIPLFLLVLLVILCGRLAIFVSFLCGFRTLRV